MRIYGPFLCVWFGIAGLGCATTQQVEEVELSGFLGDYSMLEPGGEDEAVLVYRNPATDFTRYDKIIVDGVQLWRPEASALAAVPEEEVQALGKYLHNAVLEKLSEDYELVDSPAPGVMRLRAALTEGEGSQPVLDTLTAILPHTRLLSLVDRVAYGTHSFVGKATVEAELVDSLTGERLLAGVDRRAGAKVLRGSTSKWGDVKDAFDYWAERIRDRLRAEREKGAQP